MVENRRAELAAPIHTTRDVSGPSMKTLLAGAISMFVLAGAAEAQTAGVVPATPRTVSPVQPSASPRATTGKTRAVPPRTSRSRTVPPAPPIGSSKTGRFVPPPPRLSIHHRASRNSKTTRDAFGDQFAAETSGRTDHAGHAVTFYPSPRHVNKITSQNSAFREGHRETPSAKKKAPTPSN